MKKMKFFIVFLLTLVIGLSAIASSVQAQDKNRLYFLRDDGEFSDEERDEEAQYIYERCTKNYMYSSFFECACVAGAFRMERDVSDDLQGVILSRIYESRQSPCINTTNIAGTMYEECMGNHSKSSKLIRRGIDPKKMCQCYANEIALTYTKKPIFKTKYISDIKNKAYIYCSSDARQQNKLVAPSAEVDKKTEKVKVVEDKNSDMQEFKNTEETQEKSKSLLPDFNE